MTSISIPKSSMYFFQYSRNNSFFWKCFILSLSFTSEQWNISAFIPFFISKKKTGEGSSSKVLKYFKKEIKTFQKYNIRVKISGRKDRLREDVLKAIDNVEDKTSKNTGGILNICLNYGGQEEIIDASKKIALDYEKGKLDLNSISKESFYKYLYNDLEPIDLLIRTSGELRVSNFMLYQMAYSEFYFTDTYFPDFDEKELDLAIDEYNKRLT